jgi:hypothetical protein
MFDSPPREQRDPQHRQSIDNRIISIDKLISNELSPYNNTQMLQSMPVVMSVKQYPIRQPSSAKKYIRRHSA